MDPPDFSIDNLTDILGSLSSEDFENLKNIADQFTNEQNSNSNNNTDSDNSSFLNFDPEMIFKIMNMFEKLNSCQNDPRCNLITALKPLLSPNKRQKADMALEFIRLFSIFSMGDI